MNEDELLAWFLLLRAPRTGPVTLNPLLSLCPDVQQLVRKPPDTAPEKLRNYLRKPDWAQAETDLRWLQTSQTNLLTITNTKDYPPLLKALSNAPSALFYKGDLDLLHMPQLAVVGSRNASRGGSETGYQFCAHLAQHGIAITSGLAQGIDAIAHEGALSVNGKTIAVMATGLDRVYPARHHALAHQIADKGILVSEYMPNTQPFKGNFPQRNRIIAGLSLGTLVVEAAFKSGSLITAKLAAELGREVFAIPGSIHNPMARGCHRLIREGAKLVETAEHIMEELSSSLARLQAAVEAGPELELQPGLQSELPSPLQPPVSEHQELLDAMGFDPISTDQLVESTRFHAAEVSSMLLLMELQGHISSVSGGRFMRTQGCNKS